MHFVIKKDYILSLYIHGSILYPYFCYTLYIQLSLEILIKHALNAKLFSNRSHRHLKQQKSLNKFISEIKIGIKMNYRQLPDLETLSFEMNMQIMLKLHDVISEYNYMLKTDKELNLQRSVH